MLVGLEGAGEGHRLFEAGPRGLDDALDLGHGPKREGVVAVGGATLVELDPGMAELLDLGVENPLGASPGSAVPA